MARRFLESQLAARSRQLSRLTADVSHARKLTSVDRSTLQVMLGGETSGIQVLATQVPSESTRAELVAAETTMIEAYRVYAVMTPQARLTIAADDELAAASALIAGEAAIAERISEARSTHRSAAALAERLLVELRSELQQASGDLNGATAEVLATTPAAYPANKVILSGADAGIDGASGDLEAAAHLVDDIDVILTF
jgi:hypothetical protein